jgi:3,4-dihydroxy-2-butanone 4-phosphate synthase
MPFPFQALFSGRSLAALALLLSSQLAFADLMLFPTRIVLEKNQRAAQVELINQGTTQATYRIQLVNRRMGENGEIIPVASAAPGENFAEPLIRFSPRQVTLEPGASQTVRIMLRKPADLAVGEYRSHLQFDRVADTAATSSVEALNQPGEKAIGVSITALVGASIPVIVRQGDTEASVTLSDLSVVPPADAGADPMLALQLNRSGNRSVYGDLAVNFTPKGGAAIELAKAGGVAVYVPNPIRKAKLPLKLPAGTVLSGGSLQLSFRERPDAGGRLLATASLTLP